MVTLSSHDSVTIPTGYRHYVIRIASPSQKQPYSVSNNKEHTNLCPILKIFFGKEQRKISVPANLLHKTLHKYTKVSTVFA